MSRVDRVLARPLVAASGRRATAGHLRVLAMHGITDLQLFVEQVELLTQRFRPVNSSDVAAWYRGEVELPKGAIWFTFDDGDRSTVVDGAEVLHAAGVPATVFVCPALVERAEAPWWERVAAVMTSGRELRIGNEVHTGQGAVTALKTVPDEMRREIVDSLPDRGSDISKAVSIEDLRRWRELGGNIGNHTWDHPCLDRCSVDDQRRQIDRAADWLDHHELWDQRIFAYPNGDRTPESEAHLADEGYELVALFDHALVRKARGPLRVSRLRLDAGATPTRTAAVTSGWHSGLFSARRGFGRAAGRSRPSST